MKTRVNAQVVPNIPWKREERSNYTEVVAARNECLGHSYLALSVREMHYSRVSPDSIPRHQGLYRRAQSCIAFRDSQSNSARTEILDTTASIKGGEYCPIYSTGPLRVRITTTRSTNWLSSVTVYSSTRLSLLREAAHVSANQCF